MKLLRGFTIIELIVVMAIFLSVIGAALGIFISIITNQKKVLAEQQILNQISYAEEYMSKALRMAETVKDDNCIPSGYVYLLTRPFNSQDKFFYRGIKFVNSSDNDACQEFFLDNTTDPTKPVLKELKTYPPYEQLSDDKAVALTSTDLKINFVRFSINGTDGSSESCPDPSNCGASQADSVQPKATILLNIAIAGDTSEPDRTIQATISRRNLNVKNNAP